MRGRAYEQAANLYYQLKALPWWALWRRHELSQRIEEAWKEE